MKMITEEDKKKALQNAYEIRCDCCANWILIHYNGRWYSANYYDLCLDNEERDEHSRPLYSDKYFEAFLKSAGVSKATAIRILSRGRLFISDYIDRPTEDMDTWGQPCGYDLSGKEFEEDTDQCSADFTVSLSAQN